MSDEDGSVVRLKIRPKRRDENATFSIVRGRKCSHQRFVLDESLDSVECEDCGERLSPMWVLKQLACRDSMLAQRRDFFRRQVKALEERMKFKCGHCGAMNDLTKKLRLRAVEK